MNFIPNDEKVDLSTCEREPIHIPGLIQPSGYLITWDKNHKLVACSENFLEKIQKEFHEIHNQSPYKVLNLLTNQDIDELSLFEVRDISIDNQDFIIRCIPCADTYIALEIIESPKRVDIKKLSELNSKFSRIVNITSISEWGRLIVEAFQSFLNLDRVMLYRFDEDYNGEVIEEKINDHLINEMKPFKGLNYPSSDIPPQARKLYLKKLSRLISDVDYKPQKLVCDNITIDLSESELRSVSPIHIEYLKNMGVKATLVFSIIVKNKLWGLVACHHNSPIHISYFDKMMSEKLLVLASISLEKILEKSSFKMINHLSKRAEDFFDLHKVKSMDELFRLYAHEIKEFFGKENTLIYISEDELFKTSSLLDDDKIYELLEWLKTQQFESDIFYTKKISQSLNSYKEDAKIASGLMAMRLDPFQLDSDRAFSFLIILRPESRQELNWAGNPYEKLDLNSHTGRLSPRGSFELWKEITSFQSREWSSDDIIFAKYLQKLLYKFKTELLYIQRTEIEQWYLQSQRVVDLGKMATSVAHDFNNILHGIDVNVSLNKNHLPETFINKNNVFIDRGREIVSALLSYARSSTKDYQVLNLRAMMKELSIISELIIPDSIQVDIEILDEDEFYILGCKQEIFQVLINLITNARDAMDKQNGHIKVSLFKEDDSNFITIEDNGRGIKSKNIDQIFDPFFTTKSEGKGTGLGLAYIKQILNSHNTELKVQSEFGVGTKFFLGFPKVEGFNSDAESNINVSDHHEKISDNIKLLYVEDDDEIRDIQVIVFQSKFSEVKSFSSAIDALNVLREKKYRPDIIISDLRMPDVNGLLFYRMLREFDHKTPFILMSGELGLDDVIKKLPYESTIKTISKPAAIDDIFSAIKSLII